MRTCDFRRIAVRPYTRFVTAILAISIGNTRTHIGRFLDGAEELDASEQILNTESELIVERIAHHWENLDDDEAVVAIASVNDVFAKPLEARISGRLGVDVSRIGRDIAPAISTKLDPKAKTGVDRLLCATAAFHRLKQACIVIDAGTAITIDFVDGVGTFHGGVIAPGAQMQLNALHEHTDALPEISFAIPDNEPHGRNTEQAMLQGVFFGIRGLVQRMIERYADSFGSFPMVVATGGDAQAILENEDFVDRVVPDLILLGIAISVIAGFVDESAAEE